MQYTLNTGLLEQHIHANKDSPNMGMFHVKHSHIPMNTN